MGIRIYNLFIYNLQIMNKRCFETEDKRRSDELDERFCDGMAVGICIALALICAIYLINKFVAPYIN